MRLLLDSHAFVWYALGHSGCSPAARRAIEADDSETFFSAVTAWEIAIKMRAGRWPDAAPLLERLDEILQLHRFRPLPISVAHARTAGLLHGDHKDPFDRMLAAQAIVDDLTLVTADKVLRTLGPTILW